MSDNSALMPSSSWPAADGVVAPVLLHKRSDAVPPRQLSVESTYPKNLVSTVAQLRSAVRRNPYDSDAWRLLAMASFSFGDSEASIDAIGRAIQLEPGNESNLSVGADIFRTHEKFEEGLKCALQLQAIAPQSSVGYHNAAICLAFLQKHEEADEQFNAAIALSGDKALILWEYHQSLLARGKFAEAWRCYEQRFSCGDKIDVADFDFPFARWSGEDLSRHHILLYGEQGLGDQIMYASVLKDIIAVARKVTLVVDDQLTNLIAASFPDVRVYGFGDVKRSYKIGERLSLLRDELPIRYCLPMGSLLCKFRNSASQFDGRSYLNPSSEARMEWAEFWFHRAQNLQGHGSPRLPRIGLAWASNPGHGNFNASRRARNKSIPLGVMAEGLSKVPGVSFYSVSNVPLDRFVGEDAARRIGMTDLSHRLRSLDVTAALLETLDLVITVDTVIAHLAGALGKKAWILLGQHADARWGLRGTDSSYWYKSANLFWQDEANNWEGVIKRVRSALLAEVAI